MAIKSSQTTLYYIHDPMCSWCWGFSPTWAKVREKLPASVAVVSLLGGLASDSDQTMPVELQNKIRGIWETIQKQIPETTFNYDFWKKCTPRRATYPACRAVIATRNQQPALENSMIQAIQEAYYLRAMNPSDKEVLMLLATELSLNTEQFSNDLNSEKTHRQLLDEIQLGRNLGAQGFPSLVLEKKANRKLLKIDYNNAEVILAQITT